MSDKPARPAAGPENVESTAPARTAKATRATAKGGVQASAPEAAPKAKASPAKPTPRKPAADKPTAGPAVRRTAAKASAGASAKPASPHAGRPASAQAKPAPLVTKPRKAVAVPVVVSSGSEQPAAPAASPTEAPVASQVTIPAPQAAEPVKAEPSPTDANAAPEAEPLSATPTPAEPAPDAAPGLSADEEAPPEADEGDETDLDAVRARLMVLQQQVRAANIPVVIVVDGWNASGKGTMVSKLIEGLDPRGYQVYPIRKPTAEERAFPPMRRYWVRMPAQGNISVFCGSWYREASTACFESKAARKRLNHTYDEIVNLESQLAADGVLLLKFFLHIPRKEQKARLKELESKKATRWRVEKEDWEQNEHYEEYLRLYDAMIARTHFEGAAWHVLRSDNRRSCIRQIYDTVIAAFEAAVAERAEGKRTWDTPYLQHLEAITPLPFPTLDTFDPEQALSDPYKPAVDKAQKHLSRLQNELYRRGISMAVGFEGWDAAGKGGAIRRLTSALDARGFDVVPIAAPTPLEKSHHHLWRFWSSLPMDGNIAIFDRTWYGRVLVERVEGFCTPPQWKRAYEEINRFEAALAAHGTVLVKFWLHIDPQTQLTRFNDRETTPDKQWKITPDDWRNRDKWPLYAAAVDEMLQKTSTAAAPWTVVEANNKQFARLKVLHTVIQAVEARLKAEEE